MTAPLAVTAPPQLTYEARLDPSSTGPDWAGSWFVTFGSGKPAQGTYTEVAFVGFDRAQTERVLEEVVRRAALDLYGTAWAFTYRPDQYEHAIAKYGLRRRERVIVTAIDVWSP